MQLSDHFTLEEMTFSESAIRNGYDNTPNEDQIQRLRDLCLNVLEPLRARLAIKFARPISIHVNSGFRSLLVNEAVGGVERRDASGNLILSQHTKGEAADTTAIGLTVDQYFAFVKELVKADVITADQVIHEYGAWVHISFRREGNRKQFLRITHDGKGYQPA